MAAFVACLCFFIVITFSEATPTSDANKQWKFDREEDAFAYRRRLRQFNKSEITWRIDKFPAKYNLTNADLTYAIKSATDTWSEFIPIVFRQITNRREHIDISIRFLDSSYDPEFSEGLGDDELALCFHKRTPILIRFNGNVRWVIGNGDDPHKDLYTVALHEIGHALGLRGHSTSPSSLMFAGYTGRYSTLSDDVVRDIQALYGSRTRMQDTSQYPGGPTEITYLNNGSFTHDQSPTTLSISSTMATLPRPRTGYCTPGLMYCGRRLRALGYRFDAPDDESDDQLYRCDKEGRGIHYMNCWGGNCVTNSEGSFCPCSNNERHCGSFVRSWTGITPTNYHAVYECRSNKLHHIRSCSGRCERGICTVSARTCNTNRLYCGYEMLEEGFVRSPSPYWDFDALYNCTDINTPVKRCDSQCNSLSSYVSAFCRGSFDIAEKGE